MPWYTPRMWLRKSSIRPVPTYARIGSGVLEQVRAALMTDSDDAQERLDDAFADFEEYQPALADYMATVLGRPLGDTILALGYFLSLAIWLAFQHGHGRALKKVTEDELSATKELLDLDETLRQTDASEALDTDDVIATEQPALLAFIREHIEATLDVQGDEMDLDELQVIYRAVLIETLALSYAVQPPAGFPLSKSEVQA